ncbi:MAG: arylsulfatase A-like enzyme [Arcticibacterium sp.]|jgi:arylsulfatase A-like enzyme
MRKSLCLLPLFLFLNSCAEKKQNFVFILVDDLGWTDLGYSGSTFYETPNIDALSKKSIQFTHAYSSGSVCSPSRASIMTGKHPTRLNITDWIPGNDPKNQMLLGPKDLDDLPLEETTLAEALKANGYKTFFAGKWHLGSQGYFPEHQGFETNIGGHHAGSPPGGYYTPYKNPKLTDGPDGEYLTDRLTNESISFLDTIEQNPFFLFLTYYSVHTPIQPNKAYIEKFNKKLGKLKSKETSFRQEGLGITTLDQRNTAYASMLYALDKNIGRLIDKLKRKGLYENTTLVFTSDNGGLSTLSNDRNSKAPTSVLPLRGGKGWLYEGGIRIPLLIKPANYSGIVRTSVEPVIGHDFYPTFLSLAGITADNSNLDGVDLSPILKENKTIDRKELFWHYPHYHGSGWTPGAALLRGDWKLIEFHETGVIELYNLSQDISESNDLSLAHPERVVALQNRLHELQKSMKANSASLNPEFKPTNNK